MSACGRIVLVVNVLYVDYCLPEVATDESILRTNP